ncbi:MAG: HEAT repeat domain-containing protein [bacterium]
MNTVSPVEKLTNALINAYAQGVDPSRAECQPYLRELRERVVKAVSREWIDSFVRGKIRGRPSLEEINEVKELGVPKCIYNPSLRALCLLEAIKSGDEKQFLFWSGDVSSWEYPEDFHPVWGQSYDEAVALYRHSVAGRVDRYLQELQTMLHDGRISADEETALSTKWGASQGLIQTLKGADGNRALHERVKWLTSHAPAISLYKVSDAARISLTYLLGAFGPGAVGAAFAGILKHGPIDGALGIYKREKVLANHASSEWGRTHSDAARISMIQQLGAFGPDAYDAAPALSGVLKQGPLYGALRSVGAVDLADKWRPGLIESMRSDPAEVRASTAEALGQIGSPVAKAALMEALSDNDPRVREAAARSIGQLKPPPRNAAPAILHALLDREAKVRSAAAESLGKLGETNNDVAHGLAKALGDTDPLVRRNAAIAIRELGAAMKGTIPALIERLEKGDAGCEIQVIAALGAMGRDALSAALLIEPKLASHDPRMRAVAATALGNLEARGAEATLIKATADKEEEVRLAAVTALDRIFASSEEAALALAKVIKDPSAGNELRMAAVEALGRTGVADEQVIQALLNAHRDASPEISFEAGNALVKILTSSPKAVELAAQLLKKSTDVQQRLDILHAFTKAGPSAKDALPVVIALIQDKDTSLALATKEAKASSDLPTVFTNAGMNAHIQKRAADLDLAAIEAIASFGPDGARKAIPSILKAFNSSGKIEIAHALFRLDPANDNIIRTILIQYLSLGSEFGDKQKHLCTTIISSSPRAVEITAELISHKDPNVTRNALMALCDIDPSSNPAALRLVIDTFKAKKGFGNSVIALQYLARKSPEAKQTLVEAFVSAVKENNIGRAAWIGSWLKYSSVPTDDAVLQHIILALKSPSSIPDKYSFLEMLVRFGAAAKDALPMLLEMLNDRSFYIRKYVAMLFVKIDPDIEKQNPRVREVLEEKEPIPHISRNKIPPPHYSTIPDPFM